MEEYTLFVSSSTYGRYALDEPDGQEISSGLPLEILLGGQWIAGRIEYGAKHANRSLRFLGDQAPDSHAIEGYYFTSGNGTCGLCEGMKVRIS